MFLCQHFPGIEDKRRGANGLTFRACRSCYSYGEALKMKEILTGKNAKAFEEASNLQEMITGQRLMSTKWLNWLLWSSYWKKNDYEFKLIFNICLSLRSFFQALIFIYEFDAIQMIFYIKLLSSSNGMLKKQIMSQCCPNHDVVGVTQSNIWLSTLLFVSSNLFYAWT